MIDADKVSNTPLNGRNPFLFVFAAPGVLGDPRVPASATGRSTTAAWTASASTAASAAQRFLLDGAPNTNSEGGGSGSLAFVPSPDAVQEVRVDTNTYDAQFGRTGGGTISVSVKSGTNRYTGTAAYLHRDKSLNQNLYQNKLNNIPKTELFHANPVFTIGGPVRLPRYNGENKTFFFYNYEFLKSAIPDSANLQKAPTDLELAGDFSQSLNGIAGGNIIDPFTGQPFPGNRIPANRIDPISQAYLAYMVRPNATPDAAGNNFIASPNSRADVYQSHLRAASTRTSATSDSSRGSARTAATKTVRTTGAQEIAVTNDGHHYRWNTNLNGDLTWTIGPSIVLEPEGRLDQPHPRGQEHHDTFDSATLGFASNYLNIDSPQELPPAD